MQQNPFIPPNVQNLQNPLYAEKEVQVSVLRLDEIHPVISGNKWYKLKVYLQDALAQQKKAILTFGGAFSNHIVATAAACQLNGLQSIGIIRGEQPAHLSHTLTTALSYGMQLHFTSRAAYKEKQIPAAVYTAIEEKDVMVIGEGGYGARGAQGAMDILHAADSSQYTHIIAAVGTGTMLAGLSAASNPAQQVIGIPVLKNNNALEQEIKNLLPDAAKRFTLLQGYHFGGYAKKTPELIQFMNHWFAATGIPSDFVYTGKLFFAADNLVRNNYFPPGSRLLLIHSGGLQGNLSLTKGTLIF